MNKQEATRYAHKLAADAISDIEVAAGPHRAKILKALANMAETHARFGPRTGDKPPAQPEYKGEVLPWDVAR